MTLTFKVDVVLQYVVSMATRLIKPDQIQITDTKYQTSQTCRFNVFCTEFNKNQFDFKSPEGTYVATGQTRLDCGKHVTQNSNIPCCF